MENNYLWLGVGGLTLIVLTVLIIFLSKKFRGKNIKEKWENGKIRSKYFINKKGVKEGLHIFYFRDGKVNKEAHWVNGKLEGNTVVYYATGEKYITANYKAGKLVGEFKVFAKDGQVVHFAQYQNGTLISETEAESADFAGHSSFSGEEKVADLFNPSLLAEFNREKQEYSLMKDVEETRDTEKSKSGFLPGLKKIGKVVSGVDAYQNRKSTKNIKQASEELYDTAFHVTEFSREKLNSVISDFGNYRLHALQKTTGRFLGMLKDMKQNNRLKEYEILGGIGITNKTIEKMKDVDMATSKAIKSTATIGAVGAAAAMGTPALVTSAVGALATASTGTAISGLSGVAATNATLAWLGGGSLAAGGGGMAAGTATLATLTAGATAGVGLIAAGLIASTYYSKKLTEAKGYQKDVESRVADMEQLWVLMAGISERAHELKKVTGQLEERLVTQLEFLEPLSVDYDTTNVYYNSVFQKVGLLAKSMSELAQTPLLDDGGNASTQSAQIIQETYKVLNQKLINHG